MGVFAGVERNWAALTDVGRTHVATKGTVQSGLVLNLDAGVSRSYGDNIENLLLYSEQFDNDNWVKQNGFSITSNTAIAPDGTLTADTASRTDLGAQYLYQTANLTGTSTLSCWVRAVTGTTTFIMQSYNAINGGFVSPTFTATTTWQRFSFTATVTTSNNWYPCVPLVSGDQLYIWGAQLEGGTTVGSYYATTAAKKTRGTTWTDLSGLGNNGTLVNGVGYNGSNGGSLSFDGSNQYATIPHSSSLSFSSALTISIWFYSGTVGVAAILYLKGRTDTDNYNPLIYSTGQYSWTGMNGRAQYPPSAGYIANNTWYNLTVSHTSGSVPNIYKNGILSTSHTFLQGNATYALGTNLNPIGINADIPRPAFTTFNGRISSLQAYNRALSAAEIQRNFNAMRGRFGL